jgi:hypothetical protein
MRRSGGWGWHDRRTETVQVQTDCRARFHQDAARRGWHPVPDRRCAQHHQRDRALRVFDPIFWAEEILIFIIIWGVFLVAGSITYRGGHLNMDLIYSTMSRLERAVNIAIALTLIVCTVYTAMQSWKVVMLHYRNHGVTAGTDIPLVFPHLALLFGFTFMALAAMVRIRSYISGKFE